MVKKTHSKKEVAKLVKEEPSNAALCMVDTTLNSALTINKAGTRWCSNSETEPDVLDIMKALKERVSKILDGDLISIQKTLANQAVLMELTANKYLMKMSQAEYISQTEAYSKIAFKAQEQSRKTLTAIAEIKNPKRTAFIKQLQMNQFNNNQTKENSKKFSENENELNKKQLEKGEEYATLDIGSPKQAKPIMQTESALA